VEIPNILKLATNLSPNDENLELYTNKTSTKFHRLLLDILHKFKAALIELTTMMKTRLKKTHPGRILIMKAFSTKMYTNFTYMDMSF